MKALVSCAVVLSVFLAGCQSTQQAIIDKEDLLSAAGFTPKLGKTPAQVAALHSLPANKIVRKRQGDQFVYLYADPMVCQCIYLGNQVAYSKYQQMIFKKNLANEQQMTDLMQESNEFDYSPWGGFWGY